MEKPRAEFLIGLVLGLAAMVVPMTWWLRASMLLLMTALLIDLILRSPLTQKLHIVFRVAAALVACVLVALASWEPLKKDYAEGGIATAEIASAFFQSQYFPLLLALIIGLILGNQLSPFRPFVRPTKISTKSSEWPNVRTWFTVVDAIDRFCSVEAKSRYQSAEASYRLAKAEYDKIDAQLKEPKGPETEYDALTRSLVRMNSPEFKVEQQKLSTAQAAVDDARFELFHELQLQLRQGKLVGRAVMLSDSLPGDWEYLKPVNWVVLRFDPIYPDRAAGGGKTYIGLEIGQHE